MGAAKNSEDWDARADAVRKGGLLFRDLQAETVLRDVAEWVGQLRLRPN